MHDRRRVETKVLPEPAAAQLLARASELDAARLASAEIAELRAAAAEAGISTGAFDAALSELQAVERAPVPDVGGQHRRARRWALGAGVAALIAAATLAWTQMRAPTAVAAPIVEEAIVLRCLAPGEAAEFVRPLLGDLGTVVYSPAQAPRVLTIRATPAQIEDIRAVLDQHEAAGSPACAS